jgi:hypothetical protein
VRLFGLSAAEFSLAFAAAGLVAVLAYLLSVRGRAAVVAAWPVWLEVTGARRTPWRKLLALALELGLLLLVCLALADPREEPGAALPPVYLAVAVDVSASMGADSAGGTRLAEARRLVVELGAALGPRDRLLLMAMDDACRPLGGFTREPGLLAEAAPRLEAGALPEDAAFAQGFAEAALRGASPADARRRLVILSDRFRELPSGDPRVEVLQVALGEPRDNLALTAFELRPRGGAARGHTAFVEVQNLGRARHSVRLRLHAGQRALGEDRLAVPAGGRLGRAYLLPEGPEARVMASLLPVEAGGPLDALALDDHAHGLRPRRAARPIVLVTPGNLFLEKALGLDPGLALRVVRPEALAPAELAGAEAVVYDGLCPPTRLPALYVAPPGEPGCPIELQAGPAVPIERPDLGPARVEHPVRAGVDLADVQAQAARRLVSLPGDVELWADRHGPLALARAQPGPRILALGFEPLRSDLPLRVGFPVLVHNALAWLLGQAPEPDEQARLVGETLEVPDWAAVVEGPDGAPLAPLGTGGRAWVRPRAPGFYQARLGRERWEAAVNFRSPAESDLGGDRRPGPGRIAWAGGPPPAELLEGLGSEAPAAPPAHWPLLLLGCVWLLLFDWVFFRFRILA